MSVYKNREVSIFVAKNRAKQCKTTTDFIELALETNWDGYELEDLVKVMRLLGWKTNSMCSCMVVNSTIHHHMGSWSNPKPEGYNRTKIRRDDNGFQKYYIHSKFTGVHGWERKMIDKQSAA